MMTVFVPVGPRSAGEQTPVRALHAVSKSQETSTVYVKLEAHAYQRFHSRKRKRGLAKRKMKFWLKFLSTRTETPIIA
jgi:hypothetical protein